MIKMKFYILKQLQGLGNKSAYNKLCLRSVNNTQHVKYFSFLDKNRNKRYQKNYVSDSIDSEDYENLILERQRCKNGLIIYKDMEVHDVSLLKSMNFKKYFEIPFDQAEFEEDLELTALDSTEIDTNRKIRTNIVTKLVETPCVKEPEHAKEQEHEHAKEPKHEHAKEPEHEHAKEPEHEHVKEPELEHAKELEQEHVKEPEPEHAKELEHEGNIIDKLFTTMQLDPLLSLNEKTFTSLEIDAQALDKYFKIFESKNLTEKSFGTQSAEIIKQFKLATLYLAVCKVSKKREISDKYIPSLTLQALKLEDISSDDVYFLLRINAILQQPSMNDIIFPNLEQIFENSLLNKEKIILNYQNILFYLSKAERTRLAVNKDLVKSIFKFLIFNKIEIIEQNKFLLDKIPNSLNFILKENADLLEEMIILYTENFIFDIVEEVEEFENLLGYSNRIIMLFNIQIEMRYFQDAELLRKTLTKIAILLSNFLKIKKHFSFKNFTKNFVKMILMFQKSKIDQDMADIIKDITFHSYHLWNSIKMKEPENLLTITRLNLLISLYFNQQAAGKFTNRLDRVFKESIGNIRNPEILLNYIMNSINIIRKEEKDYVLLKILEKLFEMKEFDVIALNRNLSMLIFSYSNHPSFYDLKSEFLRKLYFSQYNPEHFQKLNLSQLIFNLRNIILNDEGLILSSSVMTELTQSNLNIEDKLKKLEKQNLSTFSISPDDFSDIIEKVYLRILEMNQAERDSIFSVVKGLCFLSFKSNKRKYLYDNYYIRVIYPLLIINFRSIKEREKLLIFFKGLLEICDYLSIEEENIEPLAYHLKMTTKTLIIILSKTDMNSDGQKSQILNLLDTFHKKYSINQKVFDKVEMKYKKLKFLRYILKKRYVIGRSLSNQNEMIKIRKSSERMKQNQLNTNTDELNDNFFFG